MGAEAKAMNKIVREHYPVEKLPEDLRQGLPPGQTVTVTVEEDAPPSREKLIALLERARKGDPIADDPVERIRALRDDD